MDYHTSETPRKKCTKCGIEKPATGEFFNKSSATKSGLGFWCRDCKALNKGLVPITIRDKKPDMHSCRECGLIYPFTEQYFHANSLNRFGLMYICKPCACSKTQEWKQADPERVRASKREEYQRNKEHYRIAGRKWYLANRDIAITNSAKWRESNPEKYRVHMRVSQARRIARKRDSENTFTSQDWKIALGYFDNKCAVCNRPAGLFRKLAMDHWVALSKGGSTTPKNIVPLCDGFGGCNESKHNRDATEWLTERYGKQKAKQILNRIQVYFDSLT